jgi:hypothetical protein
MSLFRIFLLLLLSSIFIFSPGLSFSEVKISLRNGREIIADRCGDSNGKLICEKLGGSFEIEKKDVLDIKGITIKRESITEGPSPQTGPEPEVQQGAQEKAAEEEKASGKSGGEAFVRGVNPELEKRLDRIDQRKLELREEREKLSGEREQLHKDVKEMGVVYSQEQLDSINKRNADIEGRIARFNVEIKRLNEEESSIMEELKKKK